MNSDWIMSFELKHSLHALGFVLLVACGARSSLTEAQRGGGGKSGSGSSSDGSNTSASSSTSSCAPGCLPEEPFLVRFEHTILNAVAVDVGGGILIHGYYWPKSFPDPSPAADTNEYAMKLDPAGLLVWATPLSKPPIGGTTSSGRMIATDGADVFVVTGTGGLALSKLDADGHVLWRIDAKTTSTIAPFVAAGEDGTVVVAGVLSDAIDWGAGPLAPPPMGFGAYVVAFTPSGTVAWQRGLTGAVAFDVGVDGAGNTYLVGQSTVTDALGPGFPLPNNSRFAASLDASGVTRWVHGWQAGLRPERGVIDAGELVLAGGLTAPVDVGGSTLAPLGPNDRAVVRYGADGALLGAFQVPGAPPMDGIALGARGGAIAVAMNVDQPISFGGPTFSPSPTVLALGRFAQGGSLVASYGYAADPWLLAAVAVDPAGAVVLVVSGESELTPGAGPNVLESAVAKLVP